jgi:hypothetical protein
MQLHIGINPYQTFINKHTINKTTHKEHLSFMKVTNCGLDLDVPPSHKLYCS